MTTTEAFPETKLQDFYRRCRQIDRERALECGSALRIWTIGDDLRAIQRDRVFVIDGYDKEDFFGWVRDKRKISQETAEAYMAATLLDPDLLAGRCGEVHKMKIIADSPVEIHPGLIEAMHHHVPASALRKGRDYGMAKLRERVPKEEASQQACDVALGTKRARTKLNRTQRAEKAVSRMHRDLRHLIKLLGHEGVEFDPDLLRPVHQGLSDLLGGDQPVPARPEIAAATRAPLQLPPLPPTLPQEEDDPHRDWLTSRINPKQGLPYSLYSPADRAALRVFRAAVYFQSHLHDLGSLLDQGHTIDIGHHFHLYGGLNALLGSIERIRPDFQEGAHDYLAHTELWTARAELAQKERPLLEARQIQLGTHRPAPRSADLGIVWEPEHRDHGRVVSATLHNAEALLLVGTRRSGKSHGGASLAEGATLGLCATGAGRSFTLSLHNDCTTGRYEPELLAGLEYNPDPAQCDQLWNHHRAGPAVYDHMTLVVLPGLQDRALRLLGPRRIRVEVAPLYFGPKELGKLGYKTLSSVYFRKGAEPRYVQQLSDVLDELGEDFNHEEVIISVEHKVRGPGKRCLLEILHKIGQYIRDGAHLGRLAQPGELCICDVSGPMLDAAAVLPLMVALMNAMSLSCPGHMLILAEELAKIAQNPLVAAHLGAMIAEIRHRLITLCMMVQNVNHLPKEFVSLSGIVGVFRMLSQVEYAMVQKLFAPYLEVPFGRIKDLPLGHAMMAATRATEESFMRRAREVQFRPLCTLDGGEDVTG